MITNANYQDTPSIMYDRIATVRPGETLSYSQLTSREKRDYLFDGGIRPTAYTNYKSEARPDVIGGIVRFAKSALESIEHHLLSQTLTRSGDEFDQPKPKLFHTYGTTAKILFTPEAGTPYTGIFSEKACGLARFSYAGPVIGVGIVPGLGLKFPIDGEHPSENLVVMRKLDRQEPLWRFFSTHSYNSVFQNAFTNILPLPSFTNLVMRTVNERFETIVKDGEGLHQTVENLAGVRTNGTPVAPDSIVTPYRVIFSPTREAVSSSDPNIDFRDDLAQNIAIGTPIYEVFALKESQEMELRRDRVTRVEDLLAHAERIGRIATESEFIASKYGDYRLFFKHSDRFLREEYRQ